ncbi:hypothetical protein Glove_158g17 [Diversispora epigaea]|uniref:Uncharacterized protein n=1 Tax=Diversispora epigaea TaxID=1348612 RepID=A0A397IRP4_9GLOM|nr:hypothetical protein Glove_158g17 [Diversispora epigaea]
MSAIATKIVEKYKLTPNMDISELSQYTSEFLKNLTDNRKRNQAQKRLRDGFKFSDEQVSILIPNQRSGKGKIINVIEGSRKIVIASPPKDLEEEIIREIAKRILQNRYGFNKDQVNDLFSIQKNDQCENTYRESASDVRAEAYALALSAKNANTGSSRLSRLRRELRSLGVSPEIIEATKIPDITKEANEIQRDRQKIVEETLRIDYPDHFTLELVKERLDDYNISIQPNYQALADVIIMLCICPAELITLRITDAGVTGYAKNWRQPDIPRKFRSLEKNQERAKELLTWIQNSISSGRMGDPGKPGHPELYRGVLGRYIYETSREHTRTDAIDRCILDALERLYLIPDGTKWFNRFLKNYNLIPKYLRKMGAVYGAVVHEAKNPGRIMTIAGKCLRYNSTNFTSPVQNYVIVNYRKKGTSPEFARPFQIYDED